MKKKIGIIGGGLTGCIASIYLKNLDYDVTIFERRPNLGGVISDITSKKNIFFNGPQYFYPNNWWFKQLFSKKEEVNYFEKFNLSYGSYNDLFGKIEISRNYAQIKTSCKFKGLNLKKINNLEDHLKSFQKNVSNPLIKWSLKFGTDLKKLHSDCKLIFNIGRVYFSKDQAKLLKEKNKNLLVSNLLGLPNTKYKKEIVCYPKKGYDFIFKIIKKKLIKKGINLNLDTSISIKKLNGNNDLFNLAKKLNFDFYLWCANPVPLLRNFNFGKIENPLIKIIVVSFDINDQNLKNINSYFQIFSKQSNLFRIYIYKINKKKKITLEILLQNKNNLEKEIEFACKILSKFKIKIKVPKNFVIKKEKRHMIFTNNDFKLFKNYESKQFDIKILSGAWPIVGKKNKINQIIKNINNISFKAKN